MNKDIPKNCHCCDDGDYSPYECEDTYKCEDCGHVHRQYREDVTKFHESDVYRDGQFDKDKQCFLELPPNIKKIRSERCQRQLEIVKSFIKEDESLIDLATGKGFFLEEAKKYYKKLTATDLHRIVVTHNAITNPEVEIILSDISSMDESVTYDGATAFDVLEHIDDINEFVKKVYKISNKYFIMQVPCDRPLPPPNKGVFDGHVHYFTKESLERLFCKDNLFSPELIEKSAPGHLAGGPEIIAVFKNNKK